MTLTDIKLTRVEGSSLQGSEITLVEVDKEKHRSKWRRRILNFVSGKFKIKLDISMEYVLIWHIRGAIGGTFSLTYEVSGGASQKITTITIPEKVTTNNQQIPGGRRYSGGRRIKFKENSDA